MGDDGLNLDGAYGLTSVEDNRKLYAKWAATYDNNFAQAMDFLMPGHVARLFHQMGGRGPVLDAGAGTGLVAAALQCAGRLEIDALDLSPEMLAVAAAKGLYRKTIVADMTKPLPVADDTYRGVTCCGTFTHGHVGPEALDELLRVATGGALFVLTIKTEHYQARGFKQRFDAFGARISGFATVLLPIYGAASDPEHADDTGLVATFTKT